MFNQFSWKQTNPTQNGNIYKYYPTNETEFTTEVVKSGGSIVVVYKDGQEIYRHTTRSTKEWGDIFAYLKTMSIDGQRYDQFFQNCEIYAVPKNCWFIFENKIKLPLKLFNAFKKYISNLYKYNEETPQELDELCLSGKIKKLFTTKENTPFYATGRGKSIKPITQDAGTGISPFTDTIFRRIINGEQYEHGNYHDAILDDILREENLSFSYWLVTTNKNSDYAFDAIERFPKEKIIHFQKPNLRMQEGEIAFIYVSHTHSIPIKTRIKEIYRDNTKPENSYYLLEFLDFIEEITLKDLQRVGFSEKSLVKTQEFKRIYLSDIYAKRKRDAKISKEKDMEVNNPNSISEAQALKRQPLNQILYGSPGTGKTYSTIDKALEIIMQKDRSIEEELREEISNILTDLKSVSPSLEKRKRAKEIFDDFKEKGQIEFITFHQSYGYEEFVEGIKPIPSENESNISYKVTQGIFKRLCKVAEQNYKEAHPNKYGTELKIENLVDTYLNDLRKQLDNAANGYLEIEGEEGIKIKILGINSNNGLIVQNTKRKDPQTISTAKGSILYRDYQNFLDGKIQNKEDVKPAENSKNKQHGNAEYYYAFYNALKKFSDTKKINQDSIPESKPLKPYILIIDEINRGNVSKIFGELITLIEPSKRIGESEELRVTLPYSGSQVENYETKELFGVPSNLYIIGTMNTADRSITSLDTALRRRFEFVEMMPNPAKLGSFDVIHNEEKKTINLQKMLQAINERIEFLYDREKTIGHAYLLDVKNLDDLKEVFQNKIIPLLQEYFHNNYAMIQAILNNNMIEKEDKKITNLFSRFGKDLDLEDKPIYKISLKEEVWNNPQTYIDIYSSQNQDNEDKES